MWIGGQVGVDGIDLITIVKRQYGTNGMVFATAGWLNHEGGKVKVWKVFDDDLTHRKQQVIARKADQFDRVVHREDPEFFVLDFGALAWRLVVHGSELGFSQIA